MADKGKALRQAAMNGKVDEARRLLDEGANIEYTHVRRPPCAAWRRARVCVVAPRSCTRGRGVGGGVFGAVARADAMRERIQARNSSGSSTPLPSTSFFWNMRRRPVPSRSADPASTQIPPFNPPAPLPSRRHSRVRQAYSVPRKMAESSVAKSGCSVLTACAKESEL